MNELINAVELKDGKAVTTRLKIAEVFGNWQKKGRPSAVAVPLQIDPGQVAALQAVDEHLGRGDVGGHRDVVHVAQAQQVHVIGLVGLGV